MSMKQRTSQKRHPFLNSQGKGSITESQTMFACSMPDRSDSKKKSSIKVDPLFKSEKSERATRNPEIQGELSAKDMIKYRSAEQLDIKTLPIQSKNKKKDSPIMEPESEGEYEDQSDSIDDMSQVDEGVIHTNAHFTTYPTEIKHKTTKMKHDVADKQMIPMVINTQFVRNLYSTIQTRAGKEGLTSPSSVQSRMDNIRPFNYFAVNEAKDMNKNRNRMHSPLGMIS